MLRAEKTLAIIAVSTHLFLTTCQKDKSQDGEDAGRSQDGKDASNSKIIYVTGIGIDPASWSGCPTMDYFPNDPEEAISVEATDEAIYCATFYEGSTLKEGLERKALLRVTPGIYTLPDGGGNDVGLPICLRLGEEAEPIGADVGQATHIKSSADGDKIFYYRLEQPMTTLEGFLFRAVFSQKFAEDEPFDIVLNGLEDPALYLELFDTSTPLKDIECEEEECFWHQQFDSCTHASSHLNRHDVQLDAGDISFELRIADLTSGTENAAFVHSSGEFRGESFEQSNHFKLVYSPSHHHFIRNFAVLFDTPIDGMCGVEVTGLESLDLYSDNADTENPQPFNEVVDEAYAVDCELNHLEELTVQGYTLKVDP